MAEWSGDFDVDNCEQDFSGSVGRSTWSGVLTGAIRRSSRVATIVLQSGWRQLREASGDDADRSCFGEQTTTENTKTTEW